MNIPVWGSKENYSYLVCPDCGKKISVFGESHIEEVAAGLGIPVLGKMPVDTRAGRAGRKNVSMRADNRYLEDAVNKI